MLNINLIPNHLYTFVRDFDVSHPTAESVQSWWKEMSEVAKNFPFPNQEMHDHFMEKRYNPMAEEMAKLSSESKTQLGDLLAHRLPMQTFIGDLLRDNFEFYDSKDLHDRLDEEFSKHTILTSKEIDAAYDDIMQRISAPEVATDGLVQYFLNHSTNRLANQRRAAKEDMSISRERLNRFVRTIISMRRTLDTDRETLKARHASIQARRELFALPNDEKALRERGMALTLNKMRLLPELFLEWKHLESPNMSADELKDRFDDFRYNGKALAVMRETLLSETSSDEEKEDIHRKIYSWFDNAQKSMQYLRERPGQEENAAEARRLFQLTRENLQKMNGKLRERLKTIDDAEVHKFLSLLAGNVSHMARKQIISLRNSQFEWTLVESFMISTNFILDLSDEEIATRLAKRDKASDLK